MIKHLVDLGDYLDKQGKVKQANIVDTLISKAQRTLETTQPYKDPLLNEPTDLDILMGDKEADIPEGKIPFSNDLFFDLDSAQGQKLLSFMHKVFRVSDEATDDAQVSIQDMREIVDMFIKLHGETLQTYPDMDSNPNPISPAQFRNILGQAKSFVSSKYSAQGNLNTKSVYDLTDTLYKLYEDMYLEGYMGLESDEQFFMNHDLGSSKNINPNKKQVQDAHRLQDAHESKMYQQEQMSLLRQQLDPEGHERKLERQRQEVKDQNPEKWHDLLLPPED